jgi:hypothetical protein
MYTTPRTTRRPSSPTCMALLSLLALLVAAATASSGSLADLDAKYGFRGFQFGSPPTADMNLIEDDGDIKYYSRPSDDLHVGHAKVESIVYGFYRDRYYWMVIQSKGVVNGRALLRVLRETYGPGSRAVSDQYWWRGKRVTAHYDENPLTKDAKLYMSSNELSGQKKADEKARERKGVGDISSGPQRRRYEISLLSPRCLSYAPARPGGGPAARCSTPYGSVVVVVDGIVVVVPTRAHPARHIRNASAQSSSAGF